jgi:RHS repeat-associated protein
MAINEFTGFIEWTPTINQVGINRVVVQVSDFGLASKQDFDIVVGDPLLAALTISPQVVDLGEVVNISVDVTNPVSFPLIQLTINGSPVALDGQNQVQFLGGLLGLYEAQATVDDGEQVAVIDGNFIIKDPGVSSGSPIITSAPISSHPLNLEVTDIIPVDLTTWEVVGIPNPYGASPSNWQVTSDQALQLNNADPSMLLSDFVTSSQRISGTLQVETETDDDFIGFVFGYQDLGKFYIFDWKQGTQFFPEIQVLFEQGMTVTVFDQAAGTPLDLGAGLTEIGTVLFENTIPWEDGVDYEFSLAATPGKFTIVILQDGLTLETITIEDDAFIDGRFGLYNFSQNDAAYKNITQQAIALSTYFYQVEAIDPDGDSLLYSLLEAPPGMQIDPQTGEIVWLPTEESIGNFNVRIQVEDSTGLSTEQSFVLAVTDGAPLINSTAQTRAFVGQNYFYQLTAYDASPGEQFVFMLDQAPSGMGIDSVTGLIQWVPEIADVGDHIIDAVVEDQQGNLASQSFVVNVSINNAPVITSEPTDTNLIEGQNFSYQVEAIDDDGDPLSFFLDVNPFPFNPTLNRDTGLLSVGAELLTPGQHAFRISVGDDKLAKDLQLVVLNVQRAGGNQTPVISSTPLTFVEAETAYTYQVEAVDFDGDSLTFALTIAPEGMMIGQNGLVSWVPASTQLGSATVEISVDDGFGAVGKQRFNLFVGDGSNLPLVITSAPVLVASTGSEYLYQILADDPEGDILSYSLEVSPIGMSINTDGLISWTPEESQIGSNRVEILIDDGKRGTALQIYDLVVSSGAGSNTAPTIISTPLANAVVGFSYSYDVEATDLEGDAITFSLVEAPAGMSIDPVSGLISWTPDVTQVGIANVIVGASDGALLTEQLFSIDVSADPLPLSAVIVTEPAVVNPGESSLVTVDVSGGVGPASVQLTVNGDLVALDANNQVSVLGDTIGVVNLQATIDDGNEVLVVDAFFTVADPSDVTPPVVEVISPIEGDVITSITDITGSVVESNLAEYTVSISPARQGQFTVIATGDTEQASAVLAQFDPTLLVNGQYDILLQAIDFNGQVGQAFVSVLVDGDLKVGNFSFTLLDLEIPVAGIPIRVTRTYDSRRRGELLDFGHGWSVGYQDIRVDESRTPGAGWEKYTFQSGPLGSITNFCVRPLGNPTVAVTLPDGDVERFVPVAVPECNLTNPNAPVTLGFDPIGDTQSTLDLTASISLVPQGENLVLLGNPEPYDPQVYKLTTRNELEYTIDQNFGVNRIDEPNGNFLTFDQAGIVHSTGKSIDFNRDGAGKITSITDPAGNVINYFYDANNDLIEARDQVSVEANVVGSTYTYNNNHGLVDMFDPLGRRLVKNIYDDDGRLIAQEDENGIRTDFNHDLAGQQSIVTDRNNNTTVFFYDDRGNVTSQVDAENGITSFTYDAFDNQLSQTDPLDNLSSATYNSNNDQLTQTDALLNTVEFTYNDRGDELTIEDARNNVFTNTYDSFGNLLTVEDPLTNVAGNNINAQGLVSLTQDVLGNTTSFTYDGDGNKLTETDAELNVTTFTYDDNGNVLTESRDRTVGGSTVTDVTTFEYDAMNRVTRTIDADNKITDTFYDGAGNQMAVLDPLGRLTEFEYDAYGRLTKTIFPDLTEAEKTYDPEGNLISEVDRLGRSTTFDYDKLNRLIKTTFDDLTFTETEYDAAGRVTAEIDERGNRTEHGYDDAGRRTSTTDALLNVTSFAYDEDGNLTSQTDANLHTTTFVYNALDQRTQTEFHDTTTIDEEFDALGRLTKRTDQDNKETQFEYDGLGRLTAVVDALNQRTEYEYDEAGNKTVQRDANLHETTWTYDALGRVLSRTLPLSQSESFTYDANGNQLTRTDFNGDTTSFEYDDNDRLTKITYQDLSEETFTYDAVGNRLTATDASGTITYAYDVRNRLELETKPDGSTLAYEYDDAGNRTEVMTTVITNAGSTTLIDTHTFDVLNRLATSTDSGFNTTTYGYDDVGNRASIDHPNGNDTVYTYDDLNRLIDLSVFNGSSALVDQFVYTLHSTGRREVITELGGRVSTYVYDDLYRLTSEAITDAVNGNHNASYVYDLVGNRTSSVINGVSTAYSYDDNDRLMSAGGNTYSYDDNGNTLTKTEGGVTTTNVYDLRNKLVSSTTSGVTTAFDYDVNGLRTSRGAGGSTTSFITDSNRDFGQVVAEVTDGDFVLGYSFGDDLVSQVFPGGSVFFFHYDGLGSTRSLSDNTGTFTDEYDYEAFGELTGSSGTTDNDYLFAGEQFDGVLGDYYLRARYYDQGVGRFTQMDEFQGLESDPITLQKYVYANSDPINNIDPSGFFTTTELATVRNAQQATIVATQPAPQLGFSFIRNAAGHIAGIAATTCAASIAATSFGIIEPIAQFSDKCDGSQHRGRWQAQGNGLEKSEPWNQSSPLTLSQGLSLLEALVLKLNPTERRERLVAIEQAKLFARRISVVGGISARDFRPKSFPNGVGRNKPRIDLEIRAGRAFVPN